MIKTLLFAFGICLLAVTANAKGSGKGKGGSGGQSSPELKELIRKYDKNRDGKLDESERAAMTNEDKEKLAKLRDNKGGKKGSK